MLSLNIDMDEHCSIDNVGELEKKAYLSAISYLSRREYSQFELCTKLGQKGFNDTLINTVLVRLVEQGYQSDERFAFCFIRSRIGRGHGPKRIVQDLIAKGVNPALFESIMEEFESEFCRAIVEVRQKKYKNILPESIQDKQTQARFLLYRGFTPAQINNLWFQLDISL